MDHFQLGRAAFEARQFVEAEGHLKRVETTLSPDEFIVLRDLQFHCAKILRPASCWIELKVLARLRFENQSTDDLLEFLDSVEVFIPTNRKSFFFEMKAHAIYKKGALALSRDFALKHVEHMLAKKMSSELARACSTYESWFPQSFYFSFLHFQALILLEDVSSANKQFSRLSEILERRWAKIEDKKENTKHSLLSVAAEFSKTLDSTNGDAVLFTHKVHLAAALLSSQSLVKEEWKKLVELVLNDASWENLKLALELAIKEGEHTIALEAYATLKRKRGFSFVKLTRHDSTLKDWLLDNAGARQQRSNEEEQKVRLTPDDLKLTGPKSDVAQSSSIEDENEDSEELKAVEMNAIKQLQLYAPGVEVLLDLLVAYKTLGFKRVVSWLLENCNMDELKPELKRKFQYFQVIHAMDLQQNHLGLALIESMLGEPTLSMDEFKELKYVQGCLLMNLKLIDDARQAFKAVFNVDPTYRQTKERMNKIAQG